MYLSASCAYRGANANHQRICARAQQRQHARRMCNRFLPCTSPWCRTLRHRILLVDSLGERYFCICVNSVVFKAVSKILCHFAEFHCVNSDIRDFAYQFDLFLCGLNRSALSRPCTERPGWSRCSGVPVLAVVRLCGPRIHTAG
jgi:hypothetical protein